MDYMNSVLIVDDDEALLEMLKTALSIEGYRCETAANVEKALDLIKNVAFDILIADIKMPGMTGLELTENAKKIRPDMAAIVMTAYIEEFFYDSAIEVGASDFIKSLLVSGSSLPGYNTSNYRKGCVQCQLPTN